MNLIASVIKGEEGEVILKGKPPDILNLMNRTEPRFHMGWGRDNTTKIRIFGTEYDVWYLEMWVREEALHLNIRYQEEEHIFEKFLIDNPDTANEAHDLMLEAWGKS